MDGLNLFMAVHSVENAKLIAKTLDRAINLAESIGGDVRIELKSADHRSIVTTTISYETKKEDGD